MEVKENVAYHCFHVHCDMCYSDTEALDSQHDPATEGCVFLTNAPIYSVAL